MSVINTNISSIQAQNSLRVTQLKQSTAMERLSSGVRINSAKDDAAGLAISTRMTANIRGLAAAVRNANDGISLTQTAEGALGQISDNLQRIRELAVQSANTGNNASDRAALNNEATQLVSEIDRVANNSMFNGIKLLDGSLQNQPLQVGAGNDANDRINISIGSAKSSSLGVGGGVSYNTTKAGTAAGLTALVGGALAINGVTVGAATSDGVSSITASASGIAVRNAINAVSDASGVTATVGATTTTGTTVTGFATAINNNDVKVNGVSIGAIAAAANAGARGGQVAAAVNAITNQTGVTATFDSTTGAVALTAADGRNIAITAANAGGSRLMTGLSAGSFQATALGTALTASATIAAGAININGVAIDAVAGVDGRSFVDHATAVVAAINLKTAETGVSALQTTGAARFTLGSMIGATINYTTATSADTTYGFASSATLASATVTSSVDAVAGTRTTRSSVSLSSNSSAGINVSGITAAALTASGLTDAAVAATQTFGAGVSSVDLTTASGSQAALSTLDSAINTITNSRASMGAYQNRLSASISNLETTSMNLQASRSRIMDTDYAKESTNLAKSQIVSQAATAMLAQANQSQQSVLALLK